MFRCDSHKAQARTIELHGAFVGEKSCVGLEAGAFAPKKSSSWQC